LQYAQSALSLDPDSSRANLIIGAIYACHFQWEEAAKAFARAKDRDSEYVGTHPYFAAYLMALGRKDEAIEIMTKRTAKNPYDPNGHALLDIFRYAARIYEQTPPPFGRAGPASLDYDNVPYLVNRSLTRIETDRRIIEDTNYAFTLRQIFILELDKKHFYIYGASYFGQARLKSPKAFLETQVLEHADLKRHPQPQIIWDRNNSHPLAVALNYLKDLIEWEYWNPSPLQMALAWMALAEIKIHGGVPHHWYKVEDIALQDPKRSSFELRVPVADGRKFGGDLHDAFDVNAFLDLAISALEYACEACDPVMAWLHLLPIFDPLRDRPAFRELIKRMNLPNTLAPVLLPEDSV
jgi:tetratricopeptide (TPR) repeat protein